MEMYGPKKIVVPKAPALGLLLEYPVFENYNERMEEGNAKIKPDIDEEEKEKQLRPPIEFELYREQMEKFKADFIYENMRRIESESGVCVPPLCLCSIFEEAIGMTDGSAQSTRIQEKTCNISIRKGRFYLNVC
jgi:hypothetical protein